MDSFERAFSDAEQAAAETVDSAGDVTKLARQLQKAAREGNIAAIRRLQGRLDAALGALGQTVANAVKSWPFQDEDEERYLRDGYCGELCQVASKQGLNIHERDGRLISHPSIVRILPGERSVKLDNKRISAIRPSYLTDLLLKNQRKPARFRAGAFLESLYNVYLDIVREERSDRQRLAQAAGRVVPLERIYRLFTSLPGSSREYDHTDFARDLYMLDTQGPKRTKQGAEVSFPASTGTRSSKGVFSFVGPDGRYVQYYGLRFAESD